MSVAPSVSAQDGARRATVAVAAVTASVTVLPVVPQASLDSLVLDRHGSGLAADRDRRLLTAGGLLVSVALHPLPRPQAEAVAVEVAYVGT